MIEEKIITAESSMGPAERLALLNLPLTERRKILTKQAERLAQHYEEAEETREREVWQGGDIVDL